MKPTVLIVEDEAVNRRILRKMLSEGYEVMEAANGREALEIIEGDTELAAVLLDLVMPVMNGFETLAHLQETGRSLSLPVIVMTGETDGSYETKALSSGAWDFVTKPYRPAIILSRLKNAIDRAKMSAFEQVLYLSEHDTLTGLYNRRKTFGEITRRMDEHPDRPHVFLRMDVDRFRLYNSAYGEEEGDRLLKFVADTLRKLRGDDRSIVLGHIDADVFCLFEEYEPGKPEKQVEALQQTLGDYRPDYLLEFSVGACVANHPSTSPETLYIAASTAAKRCKNQVSMYLCYYDEAEGTRIAEEEKIVNEMHRALADEEFVVYYQPKYDLANDEACGAEALVRWKHPTEGLIPPGRFIPIFEKNGFIAQLDYYVWEHVCQALQSWLEAGCRVFPVSVNISRVSLYNPNLLDKIQQLIHQYNVPRSLLQLEITESAYMSNPDLMKLTIDSFHEAGFTLLMDDFGSGHSSLNTLKNITMDVLKVDMKFLPISDEKQNGEIILASVIRMANWLGMSVVVEGVETEEQKNFLYSIGCSYVQGYFYARPLPQEEFEEKYIRTAVGEKQTEVEEDEEQPQFRSVLLIVDDDEVSREILHEYFKELYAVHLSASVEDAMLYLKKNAQRVRLILIDNYMPGMTGLDFLEYYRSDPVVSWIPKIMITASSDPNDQAKAFERGAYDFIPKPFVRELVIARVGHVLAISQQMRSSEKLGEQYKLQANHDDMTGLLNKSAGQSLCARVLENDRERLHAMLIVDIDNFKSINDTYGHAQGDEAIKCVAAEMQGFFRQDDVLCRFGGDEFMILMVNVNNRDGAKYKAHSLVSRAASALLQKAHMNGTISVGLAFSQVGDRYESLFQRADQALYDAKRTGKGKVCVCGETVPPIRNDDKPIVLICSENPQLFPTLALAYDESAAFANITSLDSLKDAFAQYSERIGLIVLDVEKKTEADSDVFYQVILENGGGERVPILATYPERNMELLRVVTMLAVEDVFSLPASVDVVRKKISQCLMAHGGKGKG